VSTAGRDLLSTDELGVSGLSLLASFIVGGLTGATVALLFVPRSDDRARVPLTQPVDRVRQAEAPAAGKGRAVLHESARDGRRTDPTDQRRPAAPHPRSRSEHPAAPAPTRRVSTRR
jgi:hypothetical protein